MLGLIGLAVYSIQTNKQTDKPNIFVLNCLLVCPIITHEPICLKG